MLQDIEVKVSSKTTTYNVQMGSLKLNQVAVTFLGVEPGDT